MRRLIEVTWGVVLVLVSATVLGWIAYSYTLSEAEPRYPWWWAVVLVVLWSYAIRVGIRRIRGSRRESAQENVHT